MDIVTDPNILKAIEDQEIKIRNSIDNDDIVTDPKILKEIENQSQIKKEEENQNTFYKKYVTGEARTQYKDIPGISEAEILDAEGKPDKSKAAAIAVALSITPTAEAQVDMIKKIVPGTIASKDKFNNTVLSYPKNAGGATVYLNKPGISMEDINIIPNTLIYIPGAGLVSRRVAGGIFKKGVAQGTAAAGTSVAQDVGAIALGSEQGIEGDKAAISFAGGFIAEPVGQFLMRFGAPTVNYVRKKTAEGIDKVLPEGYAASQFNIFSGKGLYLNSKGVVTKKTIDVARKAGVDSNIVNKKTMIEFAQALEDGVEPSLAKELVGANQFGISLWKAQAMNDKGMLKKIQSMRDGAYGNEAIEIVAKQDELQIKQSLRYLSTLRNRLLKDPKNKSTEAMIGTAQSIDESTDSLTNLIKNLEEKQRNIAKAKYQAIDFDGTFKTPVMKKFTKNIKNSLEDPEFGIGGIPDSTFAPTANKSLTMLNKFAKQYSKKGKKFSNITVKKLENERKRINNFLSTTKDPTDKKALMVIKREYDKFFFDSIEKGLAGGDPTVVAALKSARSEYRKLDEMFNPQDIIKKGGRIKDKGGAFIQNVIKGDYGPEQISNFLYGNASLGKPYTNQSLSALKRIEKLFPKGSEGWDVLKDGAFLRLVNSSMKKTGSRELFSPELFVKSVNESINGRGRAISNAIYTKAEKETLMAFSKEVEKTLTPKILLNPSKTASTLLDLMGGSTARAGLGVIAYNVGGMQAMLFARFGFDKAAKNTVEAAARKTLMEAIDTSAIPSATGFQGIINYGIENRPVLQKEKNLDPTDDILRLLNKSSSIENQDLENMLSSNESVLDTPSVDVAALQPSNTTMNQDYNSLSSLEKDKLLRGIS